MTLLRLFAVCAALGAAFGLAPAMAQADWTREIEQTREVYAEIRSAIDADDIEDAHAIEERLRALREDSRARLSVAARELEDVRVQLAALGAPPGEDDPPETADLAEQRANLNEEFGRIDSQITQINANIFEANDLLSRLSASQVQTLYERLLTREAFLVSPSLWRAATTSAAQTAGKIDDYFTRWTQKKRADNALQTSLAFIGAALAGAVIIFWPLNRWLMSTFAAAMKERTPTTARRVVAAGLKMLARVIPGVVGGFLIVETLRAQGLIESGGEPVARALWLTILDYLIISGFLAGLFAPANPAWRLAPVAASRARIASAFLLTIVIVFGLKVIVSEILIAAEAASESKHLVEAFGAIIVGVFLLLLCRRRLWIIDAAGGRENADGKAGETTEEPLSARAEGAEDAPVEMADGWRLLRRTGRALAIVTVAAAIVGYVSLADFIASRVYFLASFLALAWFARALVRETAFWLRARIAASDRADPTGEMTPPENFKFWTNWLINLALVIILIPAVFVLAGVPASTVIDLVWQAFFGFNIGGVRIPSLANFALAVAVFIAVMALTKLVQRGVEKGPFAHSQINPGVQHSLITLIGYGGMVVALFAAVSTIGFDLTNLALIAGALSVGIGFGLQSIVNNFVSGLILLFERPIKVGDWIITQSGEGIVKKISVRSTEIETWDRSSIIIPNSELITSTVTNWTHKNKIGRVVIKVGVSYNSDPYKVKDILLKCAHDHPLVVAYPEPFISWQDYGDSSLDFDLRVYLADISNFLTVRTELRFAIFQAFKEAGIEIPFPQRDVHVKSWPPDHAPLKEKKGDA